MAIWLVALAMKQQKTIAQRQYENRAVCLMRVKKQRLKERKQRMIGSLSPVPQVFLHFSPFLALRILKTKMWTMDGVFATLPVALMK